MKMRLFATLVSILVLSTASSFADNTPPVLTVPADQIINELSTLSVTASAEDADVPANTLTFSLDTPLLGFAIDSTNGAITWLALESDGPGTYPISVVVTDDGSPPLSASNSFTVTVDEVNSAPVLTVPADRTVNDLTTLSVIASAEDADVSANTLTYSLLSPPTGMTINADTGVISWEPTAAQALSTNVITVVVSDNAPTPLSATNSFVLVVGSSAPTVLSVTSSNHVVTITWNATADQTYQLQFKSDLTAPNWSTLSAVTASGSTASLTDSLSSPKRFYRVVRVP